MNELFVVTAHYADVFFIFEPQSKKWWKAKFSLKTECVECIGRLLTSWYGNDKEKELDLRVNFVDNRDETHYS